MCSSDLKTAEKSNPISRILESSAKSTRQAGVVCTIFEGEKESREKAGADFSAPTGLIIQIAWDHKISVPYPRSARGQWRRLPYLLRFSLVLPAWNSSLG